MSRSICQRIRDVRMINFYLMMQPEWKYTAAEIAEKIEEPGLIKSVVLSDNKRYYYKPEKKS